MDTVVKTVIFVIGQVQFASTHTDREPTVNRVLWLGSGQEQDRCRGLVS